MARDEATRERESEKQLLDRRGYLQLAGAAAASITAFGSSGAANEGDDALLYENFADDSYTQHFTDTWRQGSYDDVVSEPGKEGSGSLCVDIPQNSHYGLATTFDPVEAGVVDEELTEMYASYWLRLSPDFEADSSSSKLPGPSNTEPGGGKGGTPSTGTNGWSARTGFSDDGNGDVRLGYYTYHMDMTGSYGDNFWATTIPRDQWVKVEQYIKLNSVSNGSANRDGVLKMWVDGDLHVDQNRIRFTEEPERGVNYKFVVRFGGKDSSPIDQAVHIDGWTVSEAIPSESSTDTTTSEPTDEQSKEGVPLELISNDDATYAEYEFAVEGSVAKHETENGYAANDNDTITDNGDGTVTVDGLSGNGYGDAFLVDGEILSIDLDESEWTIRYDGEEVTSDDLTGSSSAEETELPNQIVVDGSNKPGQLSHYEFSVSGEIEKDAENGSINAYDTVSADTAKGRIIGGKDAFRFSGELTTFKLDGPATVHIEDGS